VHAVIATNVQAGCTAAPLSGKCWHLAKSLGLPHQQISGIAVDPKDPRTLYASVRQEIVLGSDPHVTGDSKVFVSHDAGDHFTDITGDLPRVDVHSLVLRNGQLIVANDVGVFVTKVGSAHWNRLGSGLPQVPFRSMKLDLSGRYLIAGAYGRGAWVYDFGSAAAAPAVSGGVGTKVQGEKIGGSSNLPATGTEATLFFGIALLSMAAVLSRRLRRTP
jgi:LPXTG-motif cell wall-anchored protein